MTANKEFRRRPVPALAVKSVALAAGLFSVVICTLLVADFVRLRRMDPLNDPQLLRLRHELAQSTGDSAALIEQIRTYDLYARRAFFGSQAQRRAGGLLLLGGASVCFMALKLAGRWNPKLPVIGKSDPAEHGEHHALFRQLMAGTAILFVVLSLFLAFAVQSDLDVVLSRGEATGGATVPPAASLPGGPAAAPALLLPPEMQTNWPSLRGPGGYGVAHFTNAPVAWDVAGGNGVLWKTEVPVHGFNSPVVWGRRVFLSGADKEGLEVFCFDGDSGKTLWTRAISSSAGFPEVSEDTGYAAPTMTTDGRRVFAIFANGELVCLDTDGNPVWQKNLGVPKNPYGMGSSLITDGERLFVQYDHDDSQQVMAFANATGERVWQTPRKHISWSSPALIGTATGLQLILNDEANTTAYDPVSGQQLWAVKCLGGEVAPSPAYNGQGIVFVANEYAKASALKLTGGTPEILWQYDEYLPEICSPVAAENHFFITTSAGDAVCLDAVTGAVKWEHEFDEGFSSSPVLVGDRIYAIDLKGMVHIFAAGPEFRELGTIGMGEPVFATPAYMDGRIYIRGDKNLFCIGEE